jgi:hypothetical protein
MCICYESYVPASGNKKGQHYSESKNYSHNTSVVVAPNPAKEFAIISYALPETNEDNLFLITDLRGVIVKQYKLEAVQGDII